MAFRREESTRQPPPGSKQDPQRPAKNPPGESAAQSAPQRLLSLDAYRGVTMLALVSGGLALDRILADNPDILTRFDGRWFASAWQTMWGLAASQLEHVKWTGCSAWDLIQPSFMFMVGVAMPFSYASRAARGDSPARRFAHVVARALILVLLGIFLRSQRARMTNFTFEDVLTQIGLGYAFVYLLLGRRFWVQLAAVLLILGGYWYFFFHHPLPPPEGNLVTRYLTEVRREPPAEWNQFTGMAAHWNKHTNAAAEFDRWFLNLFPRPEQPWEGKKFWVNGGGYQTLNFVPSMVTMIFGLMAGQLLRSQRSPQEKFKWLFSAAAICFFVSMAVDTTIWPFSIPRLSYTLCPTVKRIWTPTWAVFSAGWTFWFLAIFYWLFDMRGYRRLGWVLAIVGMNSIAVYCMDQLILGWLSASVKTHLGTVDAVAHTSLVKLIYGPTLIYARIWEHCAVLLVVWLICLWMYRRKIFIRV